jgi:hypothetical protein
VSPSGDAPHRVLDGGQVGGQVAVVATEVHDGPGDRVTPPVKPCDQRSSQAIAWAVIMYLHKHLRMCITLCMHMCLCMIMCRYMHNMLCNPLCRNDPDCPVNQAGGATVRPDARTRGAPRVPSGS